MTCADNVQPIQGWDKQLDHSASSIWLSLEPGLFVFTSLSELGLFWCLLWLLRSIDYFLNSFHRQRLDHPPGDVRGRAADSELGHWPEPQGRLPKALLFPNSGWTLARVGGLPCAWQLSGWSSELKATAPALLFPLQWFWAPGLQVGRGDPASPCLLPGQHDLGRLCAFPQGPCSLRSVWEHPVWWRPSVRNPCPATQIPQTCTPGFCAPHWLSL